MIGEYLKPPRTLGKRVSIDSQVQSNPERVIHPKPSYGVTLCLTKIGLGEILKAKKDCSSGLFARYDPKGTLRRKMK